MAIALSASGCSDQTAEEVTQENTAEGLWVGAINTNRTLTAAVLDNGTYYFFHSVVANPNQIAGVIQDTGTSDNGSFTSSNTKDFGIGVPVRNATLSADYAARQFLNGSISYSGTGGGTATFTSSYNSAYDTQPSLASLAGVYNGQLGSSAGAQTVSMIFQSDGTFKEPIKTGAPLRVMQRPEFVETSSIRALHSPGPPAFSTAVPSRKYSTSISQLADCIQPLRTAFAQTR